MKISRLLSPMVLLLTLLGMGQAVAAPEKYIIDTEGAHAFIQFKIQHLGYSWLYGRFDKFSGELMLDEENPENSSIKVTVDTASLDSNHAERDKHLRSDEILNVKKYPTAEFVSTSVEKTGEKTGLLKGKLTLHGVTRDVEIPIAHVGGGKDPWGGYRHGFTGNVTLKLKDYGIDYDLGPASTEVELLLDIETIKQ